MQELSTQATQPPPEVESSPTLTADLSTEVRLPSAEPAVLGPSLSDDEAPPDTNPLVGLRVIGLRLLWSDALCLIAALSFTHLIVLRGAPITVGYAGVMAIGIPIWLLVFRAFRLYEPHRLSAIDESRRVVSATAVGIVAVLLAGLWSQATFTRAWMAWSVLLALSLELTTRYAWRSYVRVLKKDGRLMMRTLIVGTREQADGLAVALRAPGSGFFPIGFLDFSWPLYSRKSLTTVEQTDRIRRAIRRLRADCLFVASSSISEEGMLALAQAVRQEGIEFRLYTPLAGFLSSRFNVLPIGSSGVAFSLKPAELSLIQKIAKRAFDLALASVGLVLLLPLLSLVAVLIKLTSPGPALFRQERVTRGGETFRIYKFRTMRVSNDLESSEMDRTRPFFKQRDDPRLTPVGRFLRRLSIDELPQLLNVILGDMSLIGPRPLPAEQVAANLEVLHPRHEVRAGVTGWWQIQGRSDVAPEEALKLDRFYIENWSLTLDAYILLRTIGVLVTGKGAY